MFSTDRAEIGTLVDKRAESCYACHAAGQPIARLAVPSRSRIYSQNGRRILGMVTPIYNEPSCSTAACHIHSAAQRVLGVVDIDASLAEIDQGMERVQHGTIMPTAIAVVALAAIVAFAMRRLVVRPVTQLVEGTHKIATGDLDHGIDVYRLNVIPITLPQLRNRREDIPVLVERFLEQLSIQTGRKVEGISPEAMDLLMAHSWPGNVRELRNVLERGVVVASGNTLQANDLGLTPAPGGQRNERNGPVSLEEMERRYIAEVLERTGGNVSQAARILDVDRATLDSKIQKYQLRKDDAE